MKGEVLVIAGKSFVLSDGMVAYFPMSEYFKSRACASLARRHDEDSWPPDHFGWIDATFTHSPLGESLAEYLPESLLGTGPRRESCLIHSTGTLVVIDDGSHSHVLYDTKPLDAPASKNLHEKIGDAIQAVSTAMGLSDTLTLDWKSLSDEQFEQLCYDILYAHARFDPSTIRKLGNSRSRDGGRDIEIREAAGPPGTKRRKWIFQCKLTQSTSLGATKVQDIGDMLDQYGAEGFGVMTSALIDATLYDKIDSVCGRRSIESLNFSVLELSRTLVRTPVIRKRYFPGS
jgi:Restriction endonuclease